MGRIGTGLGLLAGAALSLSACASAPPPAPAPVCPAGQEPMRTAQLFFGRNIGDRPAVSQEDFQRFLDEVVTPRFPTGLTVLEGGGQWKGAENVLIREASKIVVLVIPKGEGRMRKVEEIRKAYKDRFGQESVLLVTQEACVAF
ncbi:MAG: DUF3574 domain-containing protein [Phenylobacterium sp.]|uniref:DUF3574 domain-containing protein n=1 Tax=Phenylobacterium sp. TaxID=1871053 RepID=UPI00391C5E8E